MEGRDCRGRWLLTQIRLGVKIALLRLIAMQRRIAFYCATLNSHKNFIAQCKSQDPLLL